MEQNIHNNNLAFTFSHKYKEPYQDTLNQETPLMPSLIDKSVVVDNDLRLIMDNDKKLKDSFQMYSNVVRKNEGSSINSLLKVRNVLVNWLKDSELEYTKFITGKKIKYLLKSRDKMENRIKCIESELLCAGEKKKELEGILGDLYMYYDEEDLKEDIARFENSHGIKSGKFNKSKEKLDEMKKMLPHVIELTKIKESETQKVSEKKELSKIISNSNQTLAFLVNYYKNISKKTADSYRTNKS
jgi:hypothetical protein